MMILLKAQDPGIAPSEYVHATKWCALTSRDSMQTNSISLWWKWLFLELLLSPSYALKGLPLEHSPVAEL